MIEGFSVVERIPVQWGDMDALGHVNNARFFTWFETVRIAYFAAIGFHADRAGRIDRVGPILAHTACDFLQPVEYPGEVLAGARVTRLGGKSFTHEYLVARSEAPEQPVAKGSGVVVFYDYDAETAVPIPDGVRARIRALDEIE